MPPDEDMGLEFQRGPFCYTYSLFVHVMQGILQPHEIAAVVNATHRPIYALQVRSSASYVLFP